MSPSDVEPPAAPEGATIDPGLVRSVATETNGAHRSMGTELVAIERRAATVGLCWRGDLTEPAGGIAPGVVAALLDHACSLAALLSLDDAARFGTTMSLRVDYLEPARPGRPVHARAEAVHEGAQVVTVQGSAFHPTDARGRLAIAVCKVSIRP